jgi:hypothetical protein
MLMATAFVRERISAEPKHITNALTGGRNSARFADDARQRGYGPCPTYRLVCKDEAGLRAGMHRLLRR